jgi:hypothetical protein
MEQMASAEPPITPQPLKSSVSVRAAINLIDSLPRVAVILEALDLEGILGVLAAHHVGRREEAEGQREASQELP